MGIGAVLRTALTAANGTTLVGLLIAVATGAKVRRGPGGVLIAEGYRAPVPRQTCFTVGSVIMTRRSADWLLHEQHVDLLAHETKHVNQYAVLGPLFWPAYWVACGYSYLMTGSYGARNIFERHAGLAAGGYRQQPLRPWAARLAPRRRGGAGPPDTGPVMGDGPGPAGGRQVNGGPPHGSG